MCRNKDKNKEKNIISWYWKTLGIVLLSAIVLWTIAIIAAKCFDFYISTDSAVITVIGIVAGVIVIGNYAQVREMKAELDKKITEVEKRRKENEELLSEVQSQFTGLKEITKIVADLAQHGHTEV